MARLTGTQKKSRNKFIALLIAILVVAAAIFYVVYAGIMAKSAFLENQDFASALSTAFDKAARKVSAQDLAAVKYVELYNDGENGSVYLGYDDFVEQYDKYMAEVDAAQAAEEAGEEEIPEITAEHPVYLAKSGIFETGTEFSSLDDIKYFSGVEILSLSNVSFDASKLEKLDNLTQANFSYCGLSNEDLAVFAEKINLDKIENLTFMGNSIDDWSPVESISDKVNIVTYGYTITEDGQLEPVSNEQTLTEYLEEKAKAEAEAAEKDEAEESAESTETTEETTETAETAEVTE